MQVGNLWSDLTKKNAGISGIFPINPVQDGFSSLPHQRKPSNSFYRFLKILHLFSWQIMQNIDILDFK
jgi:hypothetical protein